MNKLTLLDVFDQFRNLFFYLLSLSILIIQSFYLVFYGDLRHPIKDHVPPKTQYQVNVTDKGVSPFPKII